MLNAFVDEPSGREQEAPKRGLTRDEILTEFYRQLNGFRSRIARRVGHQETEDVVNDTFLIVARAIKDSSIRDPERLMGFARTVVRRRVAAHIAAICRMRTENSGSPAAAMAEEGGNPETVYTRNERAEVLRQALGRLRVRDREILVRFYLHEQSAADIRREMGLSETGYYLLKSRAVARLRQAVAKSS